MESHFILCGLGRIGSRVLEYLRAAGTPVVVVDNRCAADDPRLAGADLVSGDCRRPEVLEAAGLSRARGVLILVSEDLVGISTALMVRNLNPGVRIVVRMFNQNLISRLGSAVDNVVALSTSALVAPLMALIACTGRALGTFRLEDGRDFEIGEFTVPQAMRAKSIADVTRDVRVQVVAHVTDGGKSLLNQVDAARLLLPGDRLILCGEAADVNLLLAQGESPVLRELPWIGFIRRHLHALWRTLREVDLPVRICTGVLVVVIIVSTLAFHFGPENLNIGKAFYRTISLLATGAGLGADEDQLGEGWRVFVGVLRMVGVALIAAFTAIVTNYLVRANLGGALEIRRIPERGHIIICGLGNVGFRVAQKLIRMGERVVAIERRRDNPLISTARRLGVAVIVADAALAEVLRQAHSPQALAVVAATDNELANLEIALLVRELKADQRVIVRVTDPHLAGTLRKAANIRLALSIPDLAAPAFVAALFGERVRALLQVEGVVLAVVDLVIQASDALCGQNLAEVAKAFRFVPVGSGTCSTDAGACLAAGDRWTVILALCDWQPLLNREAPAVLAGRSA